MYRPAERDERAVSVIVGTLMLILVTVTAAAGLAVMVSQMQKEEMNRQAHQAAVKNELLKINGIRPVYNETTGFLEELNVSILNLNTADSRVILLGLNERLFPKNFTSGGISYGNRNAMLLVPATKQVDIAVNCTTDFERNPNLTRADTLRVFVFSSYYNLFERMFKPPVADFTVDIQTENLGVAERDVVLLDGSPSTDDGTIVDWEWRVTENGTPVSVLKGQKTRFVPPSRGPFEIRLVVTDADGMQGISPAKALPASSRFLPASYLRAWPAGNEIEVEVLDLNARPVPNATVTFIRFYDVHGNLTLSSYAGTTDESGRLNVTVLSGEGTVRVESGKMVPVFVPVRFTP
ncbi:MAG: PKD domain-containing protein [Methanolinea sp.]